MLQQILQILHTSKLSLADLLSELNIRLLDLPSLLYKLSLGYDWLTKICYQTIGIALVMLHMQDNA